MKQARSGLQYRVERDHLPGCDRPGLFVLDIVFRDSLGRRNARGSNDWVRLLCNEYECPGRVLVNAGSIVNALPKGVRA